MANYPHVPKGQNKHNPNSHYEYSTLQDMAADRKVQAGVRTELRAKRSPKEQLELLDRRLGKGVGAVKERKRLQAFLELGKSEERRHEAVTVRPSQKPLEKIGAKKAGKKARKAA